VARLDGRRALVTGGRGFIGGALCRRLEEAGAEVYTLGRTPPREAPDRRALVGDLQIVDQAREVFRTVRPHVVFHLASQVVGARSLDVVLSTLHHNLTATVNLLTAAREADCDRVILAGSMEEPDPSGDWSVPSSPYAAAKLAASTYGRMFHALFDLPVVLLRLFMVYGPGQQDLSKLIPHVITSLHRGEEPTFTSGTRLVDWIYVDDVADAFVKAAQAQGIEGATLDIGSGELTPIREVVCKLFEFMGATHAPRFGQLEDRPMEQERRADVARPRQAMGWAPRTSLDEGLRHAVAWYTAGS
jgi:UDP-glucose 4-epimerase